MDILLVDDDELILECLGDALALAGLQAVLSATAEAALACMDADTPQVVVTDINLGLGMDGLALGRAARERWPELPIVYISGRYRNLRGLSERERFLAKPFGAATLLRAIAEIRPWIGAPRRLDLDLAPGALACDPALGEFTHAGSCESSPGTSIRYGSGWSCSNG